MPYMNKTTAGADADQSSRNYKLPSAISLSNIESVLSFVQLTLQLKQTLRTGWVLRGIPQAESVADHSWHVAVMSLFLLSADSSLDVVKCVQVIYFSKTM